MTLAQILPAPKPSTNRLSFVLKAVLAAGLAFLADIVYAGGATLWAAGSAAGMLALLWMAALLICNPQIRSNRASRFALAGAGLAALALLLEPGFVAALLFLLYLGLALFLPRHGGFDNALRWLYRLVVHAVLSPLAILFDMLRLGRAGRWRKLLGVRSWFAALPLTLAGSLVFIALFSDANPLLDRGLSQAVSALSSPDLADLIENHALFLAIAFTLLWASFRPLRLRVLARRTVPPGALPVPARKAWFDAKAVIPALATFNLIFAAQNLTDMAFLWGGAGLPEGMTFSDYAHKGTNALIVAALLAAVFVLAFLRTGSPLSANRLVRTLVYAWIGQTVLMVFSSMERALSYIEAYSLTYTRLNAMIFMALVAAGLVLICWRIAKGRDGAWLVNANAACVAVVLGLVSFTNYDGVIARWNLAQGLAGVAGPVGLDTHYFEKFSGTGALVPLVEATQGTGSPDAELERQRWFMQAALENQQADWRRWTIAGAWRLQEAGPLPPRPQPAPEIRAAPNP